jgi:glucose-1-phosphate thymidylyltransferase
MRAIIPVAGVGSRLRPHTYSIPKVLINVAGKPIIGHILDKVIADGFDEATIIVGYLGDKIREYVHSHYSIRIDFVEQEERMGLAHAIYLTRQTFSADPLLIILGDTIFDVDLSPVLSGKHSAIGVKHVEDPRRFGIVEVDRNMAKRLVEKPEHPTSHLAIVGLYWIRKPKLLEECIGELLKRNQKTKGEFQLTDALQAMLDHGEPMSTFNVDGWYDCGKPETLLSTNRFLLDKNSTSVKKDGSVFVPPVFVSPKAVIERSVIGPYATIADNTVVTDSIIRNSIVSEDSQVSQALLDNSIIGNNAQIKGAFKRINIGDSSEIDFH